MPDLTTMTDAQLVEAKRACDEEIEAVRVRKRALAREQERRIQGAALKTLEAEYEAKRAAIAPPQTIRVPHVPPESDVGTPG